MRGCAHPDIVGRGYRLRVSGPDGVTSLYTGRATAAGLELDNGKFEAEGIVVIDGFREAHIAWQLDADGAVQRCELSELEPSALDKRVRLVGPDGSTPNYTRLNACGMTADVHEDGTVAIGELPSDCSGGNITWPAGARVQGIVDLSIEDLEGLADGATLELHPNRVQLEMRAPTLDLSGLLLSAEHTEAGLQFDSSLDEPTDLPELLQPTLITHIDNVAVGEMSGAELLDAAARMMAGAPYTTAPHPSSP